MTRKILIMSATSEIAQGLAKLYISSKTTLLLHGRNHDKLQSVADQLKKLRKDINIVTLPIIDLVNPIDYKIDPAEKNTGSLLDLYYAKWFDDVIHNHGLPQHLIIAQGGTMSTASGTFELNAISAIKCCEHFIRYIRHHQHNEKYKHTRFHIVFMSSIAGENDHTMNSMKSPVNEYAYACSKNLMNKYLEALRAEVKDINLTVHNSKVFLVDTVMLRAGIAKHEEQMANLSFFQRIGWHMWNIMAKLSIVDADYAASEMKECIDNDELTFWTPRFAGYIVKVMFGIEPIIKFFINGAIFAVVFVPSMRNLVINFAKRMINLG